MTQRIGIAVLGLGWMGQAHSRSVLRIPSLFPDRSFQPELVVCADTEPSRRDRAVEDFGFQRAVEDWQRGGHRARRGRRVGDRPEHAARADDRGGVRRRQGGVQREADRRQAGADRRRVSSRAGGRRAHRRRLQLPVGAAHAARARADRVRRARGDHALPRPVPVDVRQRRARPAHVAVHARPGRLRRHQRHPQPLGVHGAVPRRRHRRGRRDAPHHDPACARCPTGAASHYGRGQSRRSQGRGRERGLRLDALPLRERGDGHLRGQPHDGRPREPERVRGVRHQGGARLEPRAAQRAAVLPQDDGPELGVHDDLRRRPLPLPRGVRPGPGQRHRLRGPRRHRGLSPSSRPWRPGRASRPGFREAVDVVSVQQALIDSWDSRTWESVRDLAEGASS